jgi:hypothetical protein
MSIQGQITIALPLRSITYTGRLFLTQRILLKPRGLNLNTSMHELIALHVPRKKIYAAGRQKYPVSLVRLIKLKAKAWAHYRATKSQLSLITFKRLTAIVRRETRDFWRQCEKSVLQNGILDDFYKYVGKKT